MVESRGSWKRPRRKRPLIAENDDLNDHRRKDMTTPESPPYALRRSAESQIIDETEDSPGKLKAQRLELVRPKWKKVVLFCLMLRCLWYLGKLHSRVLTSLNSGTPVLRVFHEENKSNDDLYNSTLSQQRRNRLIPNQHMKDGSINNGQLISLPTIIIELSGGNYHWRELCQNAGLNDQSRVLITNPFVRDSPASALAMFLHHQCHVKDIRLIDPMMPDDPASRARIFRQYLAPLQKSIPTLKSVEIATVGKASNWFVHRQFDKNITLMAPTHVIHFPFINAANTLDARLSESNFRLLSYRTATLQMEEYLWQILQESSTASYLHVSYPTSYDKGNPLVFGLSQQLSSVLYRYSTTMRSASRNQLHLLPTFGPGVLATSQKFFSTSVYIEDALAAILMAMRPTQHPIRYVLPRSVEVPPKRIPKWSWLQSKKLHSNNTRSLQSLAWLADHEHNVHTHVQLESTLAEPLQAASLRNGDWLGLRNPTFPCISACGSPASRCESSIWDDIAPVSRKATANCSHVAYQVDLDQELDALPEISPRIPKLCRLAFVSASAPIVNAAIQQTIQDGEEVEDDTNRSLKENVKMMNGMLDYSGWTLIWLSPADDILSQGDNAIPVIDPTALFADHIEKVMYVGSSSLAATADVALRQIMQSTDRASSTGDKVKETRRGVSGHRWIITEPYKARKTVFFVGGAGPMYIPKNVSDFADMVSDLVKLPDNQLLFYERVVDLSRHEDTNSMKAVEFQFVWVALSVFIHDLKSKEAQTFRCEWFNEYMAWGDNRNAEELSLAFLLGLKRVEGIMGPEKEKSWFPFLDSDGNQLLTSRDEEVFIRILSQ
ncbi:hypothetical protein FisN_16Hh203 [Fistulifera solaris]|uniref:Uncharacterized protein n=1 Tax=Fistulifera solaris TaxID=1519565 RepID=A0A1Z5KTM6_FISSO|nr:hypothetical protein FisN_16Hh203 [Fistulifera solaris]|eukprot:GAX29361.1 hypothetical protein FisN_16Hh203 [Fistulifera solaris]